MDDRRVVGVEMIERGRDLRHAVDHQRPGQARLAVLDQHPAEVVALHPVHHDDIAGIDEEVVPQHRQAGMRRQAEQHPRLRQQGVGPHVTRWR